MKGLFDVLEFSQKTNEQIRCSSKNEFVHSFFGRIRGYQKSFWNYLTFSSKGIEPSEVFIIHVSHQAKIRLRHGIFMLAPLNENPHEFYIHCWDRKTLELFTKLLFWKIISDFSALSKVFRWNLIESYIPQNPRPRHNSDRHDTQKGDMAGMTFFSDKTTKKNYKFLASPDMTLLSNYHLCDIQFSFS